MGTLMIHRPNDYGGRIRRLKNYLDGVEIAGLRPNETFTLDEVTAGPHDIRGRMDWATCKPLPVEVTDGVPVTVEVSVPYWGVAKSFVTPKRAVQGEGAVGAAAGGYTARLALNRPSVRKDAPRHAVQLRVL